MWDDVITLGFTELFIGRAAAIAGATQIQMSSSVIIVFTTYIDIMTVFLLYPVLTLSYRSLFKQSFYQRHMKPVFDAATKSVVRFREAKAAGVFIFVFFPFWGTGVVVGAVLGYLLGLRTWINMIAVCLGTLSAVACWVFAYDRLFDVLGSIGRVIPIIFTAAVIGLVIAWRVYTGYRNSRLNGKAHSNEAA